MASKNTAAAVGARVRSLRKGKGLTLDALGEAASLDANYLGQIERGRQNPTVTTLAKIATALGADLTTLVDITAGSSARTLRNNINRRLSKMTVEELTTVHRILDALRSS